MVGYVFIAIHHPFLRPTVNHRFFVVAHQTTDIQLSYCGLVIFQDSLGNLGSDLVRPVLDLRKVALEAREVGLGRFFSPFDGQRTSLQVGSHEYPVVQTHQRSRMMRPLPLLIDFLMAFLTTRGIEHLYQLIKCGSLSGSLSSDNGAAEKQKNDC